MLRSKSNRTWNRPPAPDPYMTETVFEGVRHLMGWSIEVGTWNSYESTLHTTLDRYGFDRTQWGFLAFLSQGPYHDRSPDVIKKARSALGFWYDINGWEKSEDLDKLIKRCVTGYAARFQELREDDPRCTGTMTAEMMDQLVEKMQAENAVGWIQDGIVFQWAFGLRGHQVPEATFGSLNKVGGVWILTMAKDKVRTSERAQSKAAEVVYHKIIAPPIATRTVDRLVAAWRARGGKLDEPIIEKYPLVNVGLWIKAAAAAYGWDNDFIMFRGSHCLRHGAAGEARRASELRRGVGAGAPGSATRRDTASDVMEVTRHGSFPGVYRYMHTNQERMDRMRLGLRARKHSNRGARVVVGRGPVSTTDRQEEQMRLAERAEALVLIEDVLAMLDEHEGGAGGGASAGAAAWETAMEEVLVHVIQIVEALELDVVAVNQQERRGAAGAGPRVARRRQRDEEEQE